MRPWLVVAGMLFLTLAGGLVASLFLAQGSFSPSTTVTPPITFALAPNATEALPLSGSNGSSEQLSLTWVSTAPVNFMLESPAGCAGTCWVASTLVAWPSNSSGNWRGTGPFHYPLLCLVKNQLPRSTNVTLSARATAMIPTPTSIEVLIIVGAGAAALFTVGGLATFLGLFLRADPYGVGPPLVSRSAEDVEELARGEQPGH